MLLVTFWNTGLVNQWTRYPEFSHFIGLFFIYLSFLCSMLLVTLYRVLCKGYLGCFWRCYCWRSWHQYNFNWRHWYNAFQEDMIAIGAFHATEKGILTTNAAGNSGPKAGSVTSVAPWFWSQVIVILLCVFFPNHGSLSICCFLFWVWSYIVLVLISKSNFFFFG